MLAERTLKDIQDLFIQVRFFAHSEDTSELEDYINLLVEKRELVVYLSSGFQKEVLDYCFDNLIKFLKLQQYEIAYQFADAVHNLPEIFFRSYNLKQYWKRYIIPFRKKYGKQFFIQFKPIFKGMNKFTV